MNDLMKNIKNITTILTFLLTYLCMGVLIYIAVAVSNNNFSTSLELTIIGFNGTSIMVIITLIIHTLFYFIEKTRKSLFLMILSLLNVSSLILIPYILGTVLSHF